MKKLNGNLLIKNIGVLATPVGNSAKGGSEQGDIRIINSAEVLSKNGRIEAIRGDGVSHNIEAFNTLEEDIRVIDAKNALVTPGLIDAHTHLVFGGWRQNELALKLKGVAYLDILAKGGGILSSVSSTRNSSYDELKGKTLSVLDEMLSFGVTTCEAKSGYGLNHDTEIKQLSVIKDLNDIHYIDIVPTYMGAHAVPPEYKENRNEYIDFICQKMIPEIAANGLAEFCDVFCEKGVFTAEESFKILSSAKDIGLIPKIHSDEIESIGGTAVARDLKAISAEHLIVCDEEGISNLKSGSTIACLLPLTSLYLGASFAPAKKMLEKGVPIAIATDFNPGSCPNNNIQLAINLGALRYKLTPEQILTSVTLNAAAAINRSEDVGTIEIGKRADFVIWDSPDLNYICYRMGSNLVKSVIKNGVEVKSV